MRSSKETLHAEGPFEVLEGADGRAMVCTIDAKPGDLILKEEAFSICPDTSLVMNKSLCFMCCKDFLPHANPTTKQPTKGKNSKSNTTPPTPLPPKKYMCGSCNLAFCSEECLMSPLHLLECPIISKVCAAVILANDKNVTINLSTVLLIVRILLKGKLDEEGYKFVQGMLAHIAQHSEAWRAKYETFADIFISALGSELDPLLNGVFRKEDIVRLACILDTNAFGGLSHTTSQQLSTGLFYHAALLNHSCDPNVIYSVTGNQVTMRAIKPIAKGAQLFDTYVDLLAPTYERQLILMKSKSFFCKCSRCVDPTEGNRFLSGWRCGKGECSGYNIPTIYETKDEKKLTQTWRCSVCGNEPNGDFPEKVQKMREFLGRRTWQADAAQFIPFVKQILTPILEPLHPNHYLRIFYGLEVCNAYRKLKKYQEAVPLMKQVCEIVSRIVPNTTQEVDCYFQLGQLCELAGEMESDKREKKWREWGREAMEKAVRVADVCLRADDPHTKQLKENMLRVTQKQKTNK